MTRSKRLLLAGLAVCTVGAAVMQLGTGTAHAADQVELEVTIDGVDVTESSSSDPIELDPDVESLMIVSVTNTDDEVIELDWIRLAARAFNLVFVATDTFVEGEMIDPGDTVRFELPLRFFDLGSQATGLLPTEVAVYDTDRNELGTVEFTMDVKGSMWSVQGALTILLLIVAVWSGLLLARAVWKHTLPANRMMRGLRFAAFGLAVGLFISFAVGVFRIVAPYPSVWVPALLIGVLGGFAVGYLWPVRDDDEDDEDFDPEVERQTMLLGGAAAWRRSSQKGKSTSVVDNDPEAARKTQMMGDEDS